MNLQKLQSCVSKTYWHDLLNPICIFEWKNKCVRTHYFTLKVQYKGKVITIAKITLYEVISNSRLTLTKLIEDRIEKSLKLKGYENSCPNSSP